MSKSNRKRRTRAHIIADLSVNYVEKRVLECGWTVQRFSPDYGLDLLMTTFNRRGEIENGDVRLQIKATDSIKVVASRNAIAVRLEWRDMVYWLNEPLPVILVVYDAKSDRAWWLYLNKTLREEGRTAQKRAELTVSVPLANVLDREAVGRFRMFRDAALTRSRG
ncbi:MAG TPA: DUF4365 domain-containing protein [Gemmataceae bacterium]|nr:DUF4365 domain-containing protein [Gemmataceae bacterium]